MYLRGEAGLTNIRLTGKSLNIEDVHAIAVENAVVDLEADQMEKVRLCHLRVQKWGERRKPIYGVNTGFGELINVIIPPQFKSELQYNLVRSHAAGGGNLFADEIVRAIMAVRLNCLLKGHSGASPLALRLLRDFLNLGIHPIIPEQGSLGASGDLAPLSHMALALIGDGKVRFQGKIMATAQCLKKNGLKPLVPGFKEALALINGTSAMTGVGAIALVKAFRLLKLAILDTVDVVQCLQGSTAPFEPSGHHLKNHAGQIIVAREIKKNLAGSALTREQADIMAQISEKTSGSDNVVETDIYLQNSYSMRCIPQVLGPVLETLWFCRRILNEEINSANDNPIFFDLPENTFHGANFHGQYVAMACDYLNIALTEIGVLAERQLDRLVSPHLNGKLTPFLAYKNSGLHCGFEGGQYLATSIASENLNLAAPASVNSIPSNGSNQDIVSMGLIAARKSLQICDNIFTILMVLATACYQASFRAGQSKFNITISSFHKDLAKSIKEYDDSFPLYEVYDEATRYLKDEKFGRFLDSNISFEWDV